MILHLAIAVVVAAAVLSFAPAALGKINCKHSGMSNDLYEGFPVDFEMMVDNKHHILMDWTPKAACTRAVTMFLQHMDIIHGRDYNGWPHTYRHSFYEQCGYANAEHLAQPDWLRIKVVRNPYIRLVSSFFHVFKHGSKNPLLVPGKTPQQLKTMSFADYIGHVEGLGYDRMYYRHTGSHDSFQHRRFELAAYLEGKRSLFDFIIKAEDPDQTISQINSFISRVGDRGLPFNFTHTSYIDERDTREHKDDSKLWTFMGDRPYEEIKDHHPEDYSLMYNEELKRRVTVLYSWDLVLYNYSWPFQRRF